MKKKRMGHLIDYQRGVIQNLRKVIEVNDSHLAIQDKAIIRKDEEFLVATTTVNELKLQLEDTLEALSRSRSFVRIIQSDKRRSITAMAKDLFCEFDTINMCEWEILTEKEQEEWMTYLVEIMSGEKIS